MKVSSDFSRNALMSHSDKQAIGHRSNKAKRERGRLDQAVLDIHLVSAIENRETARALTLLRQGANPDTDGGIHSDTALILAVRNQNKTVVQALIEHGADLNKPGVTKNTPLSAAIKSCPETEIPELLAQAGADPYRKNIGKRNQSALQIIDTMIETFQPVDIDPNTTREIRLTMAHLKNRLVIAYKAYMEHVSLQQSARTKQHTRSCRNGGTA